MTPRPKKRRSRPYDSARTAPRSTGQRSVSRPSGYQEQELTFETRRAPSQNTTKKRRSRPYDSARTAPRSTGQRSVSRPSGYQEQELTFETRRAPSQNTTRSRAYDFESHFGLPGTGADL